MKFYEAKVEISDGKIISTGLAAINEVDAKTQLEKDYGVGKVYDVKPCTRINSLLNKKSKNKG